MYKLYILAAQTPDQLEDFFENEALAIPLFALKVLAVGFLLFALFKAISAITANKYGLVFGWIIAGAVGVFIGFRPIIIGRFVQMISGIFENVVNMFPG